MKLQGDMKLLQSKLKSEMVTYAIDQTIQFSNTMDTRKHEMRTDLFLDI